MSTTNFNSIYILFFFHEIFIDIDFQLLEKQNKEKFVEKNSRFRIQD